MPVGAVLLGSVLYNREQKILGNRSEKRKLSLSRPSNKLGMTMFTNVVIVLARTTKKAKLHSFKYTF